MEDLKTNFIGKGEVQDFIFTQVKKSNLGFIYRISLISGAEWYEVFRKKINRRFGNLMYPKSNAFGKWAWTYRDLDSAFKKFYALG